MSVLRFCVAYLLIALFLDGCGGGTSGTGLNRFEGTVRYADTTPASDLQLTIAETADSTTTDDEGHFTLESRASGDTVTFQLEGDDVHTSVAIHNVAQKNAHVQLGIKIDRSVQQAEVQSYDLRAGVVGACDHYFENGEVIRQSNAVPPHTTCVMKVRLYGDGQALGGILVGIQRRACTANAPWREVSNALTATAVHRGFAQIPFIFVDDNNSCEYRVIAPVSMQPRVEVPMHTFTFQRLHEERRK